MPNQTFDIPAVFYPARSVLGRWIRAHSVDERQAESTYVVAVVLSMLILLVVHFLGWTLLGASVAEAAVPVAAAEMIAIVGYAVLAFAGRAPAITVRAGTSALHLSTSDADVLTIFYDEVDRMERIDARTFHRHYRRYAQTRVFVNRLHDELLLLRWQGVPVVLGLPKDGLEAVEHIVESRTSVGRASSHVDAA